MAKGGDKQTTVQKLHHSKVKTITPTITVGISRAPTGLEDLAPNVATIANENCNNKK